MKKREDYTPNSKIVAAIRQLWMRSRERNMAMKQANYTCQNCGARQSVAKGKEVKLHVHHKKGIDWKGISALIRDRVLQRPEDYEVLCIDCHKKEHAADDK
jgi:5-methylcytosine-specific restriction endonuclease McrA